METYKAYVENEETNNFIRFDVAGEDLRISMTENNPAKVKDVFNKLIIALKKTHFNFTLEGYGTDLFSQVANEYVTQLNTELTDVYKEMEHYNLLEHPVSPLEN